MTPTKEQRATIRAHLKAAWKTDAVRYDSRTDKWWVRDAQLTPGTLSREPKYVDGWKWIGSTSSILSRLK